MSFEKIYEEEVRLYNSIVSRYGELNETDINGSYKLMRDSLQIYNRWSYIKYEIKKSCGRGQAAAIKSRIEEMCKYLKEVHVTSRMIWSRSRDDLRNQMEV